MKKKQLDPRAGKREAAIERRREKEANGEKKEQERVGINACVSARQIESLLLDMHRRDRYLHTTRSKTELLVPWPRNRRFTGQREVSGKRNLCPIFPAVPKCPSAYWREFARGDQPLWTIVVTSFHIANADDEINERGRLDRVLLNERVKSYTSFARRRILPERNALDERSSWQTESPVGNFMFA